MIKGARRFKQSGAENDLIANRQEEAGRLRDSIATFPKEHQESLVAQVYRGVNNLQPGTSEKMIEQLTSLRSRLVSSDSTDPKYLKLKKDLSDHITGLIQEQLAVSVKKPTVPKKPIIRSSKYSSSAESSPGISNSSTPRTPINDINTQARALVDRWNAGQSRGGWDKKEKEQILQQANASPELYKAFYLMIVLPKKS